MSDISTGGFTGAARGDHINIGRSELLSGISGYTAEQQDLLMWMHGYCIDVMRGSRSALVEWLKVDWTTVTRILRGVYGADIAQFCARVTQLRRKAEIVGTTTFVETVVTRKIWNTCSIAREQNAIVMVVGRSGRSKTHAVREWQRRNNHGASIYCECQVAGGLRGLLETIARAAGVGVNHPNNRLMDLLERSFDYRHTLIFDEVARLLPARSNSISPIEYIRRLHDVCGCGVVLVSTDIFPREMRGGRLVEWFEQLDGRIAATLKIPEKVGRDEAGQICAAFCADPSAELIQEARRIGNSQGHVRVLFGLLSQAAMLAKAKSEPLSVTHLRDTADFRESLNRWDAD